MSRILPQCLDVNPSDRSAQADVVLREEPDDEEGEEEEDRKDGGIAKKGMKMTTKMAATQCEHVLIGRCGER